jgi:hypothetical protein
VVPLWRKVPSTKPVINKAAQASMTASSQWQGTAKVVVAGPLPAQPPPRKRKRGDLEGTAPQNAAGAGGSVPAKVESDAPSQSDTGEEEPYAARRRGDDEFERQLQMALLATQEDAARAAAAPSGARTAHTCTAEPASAPPVAAIAPRAASMFWAEVFCGSVATGAWVHADGVAGNINRVHEVEAQGVVGPVLAYVFAFSAGGVKDVTRRYAASYVKSLRGRDEKWVADVLAPLRPQVRCGSHCIRQPWCMRKVYAGHRCRRSECARRLALWSRVHHQGSNSS